MYQNQGAPEDDRSSPPPYSEVMQSDFGQGNFHADGSERGNWNGVWVNRGALCGQGVEEDSV